jgi:hypothetical protein
MSARIGDTVGLLRLDSVPLVTRERRHDRRLSQFHPREQAGFSLPDTSVVLKQPIGDNLEIFQRNRSV